MITTFADAAEIQPDALVTVKVYVVPATSPFMVLLAPLPEVIIPPGVIINFHDPVAGRPLKTTLPVAMLIVGWVIVPTLGAFGVDGWALMVILEDETEIHPNALITL